MKAALVGFPGSGAKTLMGALAHGGAPAQPGKRSVTTIRVPDPRVAELSGYFRPRKTTYATVEVVLDDSPAEAVGKRLNAVRNFEVLVLVAGAFGLGPEGSESALAELDRLADEMLLADLMIVERRREFLQKRNEKGFEPRLFEQLHSILDEGRFLGSAPFIEAEKKMLGHYGFLTAKPVLAAINVGEEDLAEPVWGDVEDRLRSRGWEAVTICAELEHEVARLLPEEQAEFLEAVGLDAPASHRLVRSTFRALDLISFFTVGEDEVRAWPVRKGSPAPVAGGRVHSDIQRGFIRGEVVSYEHFLLTGSLAAARRTGRLRSEGKAYIVKDGDIIDFLFNV